MFCFSGCNAHSDIIDHINTVTSPVTSLVTSLNFLLKLITRGYPHLLLKVKVSWYNYPVRTAVASPTVHLQSGCPHETAVVQSLMMNLMQPHTFILSLPH